jgi:hypothetical protein
MRIVIRVSVRKVTPTAMPTPMSMAQALHQFRRSSSAPQEQDFTGISPMFIASGCLPLLSAAAGTYRCYDRAEFTDGAVHLESQRRAYNGIGRSIGAARIWEGAKCGY